MHKLHLLLFAALFSVFGFAQQVRFTQPEKSTSSTWQVFQTESFKGKFKATTTTLTLKVTNTSNRHVKLEGGNYSLRDISGKGALLCTAALVLPPKKTMVIRFENCLSRPASQEGIFGLKAEYPSSADFKNEAFFLHDKKWTLDLNGELVEFYTTL